MKVFNQSKGAGSEGNEKSMRKNFRFYVHAMILLFSIGMAKAQKFWLTTREFPGGYKTGVALQQDSVLFVSTHQYVMRSVNEGNQFDTTLLAQSLSTVYASRSGTVLAGGRGKIYYSKDLGKNWDSVSVNTAADITGFVENATGGLFGMTRVYDEEKGYIGDGVLFSNDGGSSWAFRNNGLGSQRACEHLTIDKNGRLYLAIGDEARTGMGGLFVSDNNGLLWEGIGITIDGKNQVPDQVVPTTITGLSVSDQDRLYLSISGVAVNVFVSLNLYKSIDDIKKDTLWKIMNVIPNNQFTDRNLNSIHFARNGDWYSSFNGTLNVGGTYYSKNKGVSWQRIDFGLGLDIFGMRNVQYFAEKQNGKIFMVQFLNELVHYTDTSLTTATGDVQIRNKKLKVFPNPVGSRENIKIDLPGSLRKCTLAVLNSAGQAVLTKAVNHESRVDLNMAVPPGVYFIRAVWGNEVVVQKVLVF